MNINIEMVVIGPKGEEEKLIIGDDTDERYIGAWIKTHITKCAFSRIVIRPSAVPLDLANKNLPLNMDNIMRETDNGY